MSTHCDVVVIGAGLGGLSAAAFLARAGLQVRVLERDIQPGGYATTFVRQGHEFEVSLRSLSGIGRPERRGPLWHLLAELGVTDRVEFLPISHVYRSVGPGFDIRVPQGHKEALLTFCRTFPEECKGFRALFANLASVLKDIEEATLLGPSLPRPVWLMRFPAAAHAANVTLAHVLERHIESPRARLAFGQLAFQFGLPPSRLSYLAFAAHMGSALRYGTHYPRGRSQALSNAFVEIIEESGGRVHLSRGARRILTSGGKVTGVLDERDGRIDADVVIANVNPLVTCIDLLGEENLPRDFLRKLAASRPSLSSLTAHLLLAATPDQLGLRDHEVYFNATTDTDIQYQTALAMSAPAVMAVTCHGVTDPDLNAGGFTPMSLTMLSDGAAWTRINPAAYGELRGGLARQMVDEVARAWPGLAETIAVTTVSTPISNMRFTRNPMGAIGGFETTPVNSPLSRLLHAGPLPGLWFASAWTRPGAGYAACIQSGREAAHEVLAHLKGKPRAFTEGATLGQSRSRLVPPVNWRERIARTLTLPRVGDYAALLRDVSAFGHTVAERSFRAELIEAPVFEPGAVDLAVHRIHPVRVPVRVTSVQPETPATRTLALTPTSGVFPPFDAGQYVNVFVELDGVQRSRPFSICSAPGHQTRLEITVTARSDGQVARHLIKNVGPGALLAISGPSGELRYDPLTDGDEQVFLARGVGIAPFRSMLEDGHARGLGRRVLLIHEIERPEEALFRPRIEHLQKLHPGELQAVWVANDAPEDWTGERGEISKRLLKTLLPPERHADRTHFVSGPRRFCDRVTAALRTLGVPPRRIRVESIGGLRDVTAEPGWPREILPAERVTIRLANSDVAMEANVADPLLVSLERAGVSLPSVCRAGGCGACRVRILDGKVFVPPRIARRASDKQANIVHACQAYPITDLLLDLP